MSETLKFGFLCSSRSLGGLELSTFNFGTWLKARGHEVFYIVDAESPLIKYLEKESINYKTINKGRKYLDFKAAKELSSILKDSDFTDFIITLSADIDLCALTKSWYYKNFRFYYFQEMQLGVDKKNFFFNWKFSKMEKWFTPLHWLKDQLKERTNVEDEKIILNPLSIEVERFQKDIQKEDARTKFELPQDVFLFGFIGRIDPGKRPHIVLDAFEKVASDNKNCHLLIMGEETRNAKNNYAKEFFEKINSSPNKSRIHHRGFTDDVATAYKAIDCFIMATPSESIGLVTIEAMASGTTVLGANGGGTPELLNFGKAGYLFTPDDSTDLSKQMSIVLDNSHNQSEKIEAAKMRASELYSSHITCDIFEEVIGAYQR